MNETLLTLPVVVRLALGAALLLVGRRLYWLFVAAAGFMLGLLIADQLIGTQDALLRLAIGLGLGLLGAVLANVFQRAVIGLAGFVLAASATLLLLPILGIDVGDYGWLVAIVAGIVGVVLVQVVFDWALIVLSAYAGANLLVSSLQPMLSLDTTLSTVALLLLLLIGIGVQAGARKP